MFNTKEKAANFDGLAANFAKFVELWEIPNQQR